MPCPGGNFLIDINLVFQDIAEAMPSGNFICPEGGCPYKAIPALIKLNLVFGKLIAPAEFAACMIGG